MTEHEPKRARLTFTGAAIDLTGGSSSPSEGDKNCNSDDVSEASSTSYDWEDPCWDHHFGLDHRSADDPYANRGRTEETWKILAFYGFKKADAGKGKGKTKYFEGRTPHPCFENLVRRICKKSSTKADYVNVNTGEIRAYSIASIASSVRSSSLIECATAEKKKMLDEMSDNDVVRDALSTDGLQLFERFDGVYFSICTDQLLEKTCNWHCRICGNCKDWRDWHCKGCNTCKYGVTIPCDTCCPTQYQKRAKYF